MVAIVAACMVWLLVRPAIGEIDKVTAKAHFEAASRLYDVQEFAKALEEYKAAYLAKPDPVFLFNIGQCYRKLGKREQAIEFYRNFLRKAPADDPNRPAVESRLRETEAGVSTEAARPQPVQPAVQPAAQPAAPAPPVALPPSAMPEPPVATEPAGVDLSSSAFAPAADPSTPAYRTWWFWTGVGAVVVAGTITAVILANRESPTNSASTGLGTRTVFP
jgi:tetratricopeptide (TPR) repeat protein